MVSPLRYHRLWLLLGFGAVFAVAIASLVSLNIRVPDIPYQDKLMHAIIYAGLTTWFLQIYHGWQAWGIIVLLMLGMGLGIELLQGLTPTRTPEVLDLLANGIGVALASLIAWTPLRYTLVRIDQALP